MNSNDNRDYNVMGLEPVKAKAPRSAGVLGDSSEAQVVSMLLLERELSGQRSLIRS